MPLERVSKGFKDLSMTFQVNPINYDLIALKNESAIARSLRNLVLTLPGERFFNDELGTNVSQAVFDNLDDLTASMVKSQIKNVIQYYEPRVRLIEVLVTPDYDNAVFNVTINYQIVGIDVLPQQLSFALQPTR
jgi:hypothetical protein